MKGSGWKDIDIEEIYRQTDNGVSPTVKTKNTKVYFITGIGILLLVCLVAAFTWIITKNNAVPINKQINDKALETSFTTPSISVSPIIKNSTIDSSISGSWLAYTQFEPNNSNLDYVTAKAYYYDLDSKKTIDIGALSGEKGNMPTLGHWSNNGQYIPIAYSKEKMLMESLYIFDNNQKKPFIVSGLKSLVVEPNSILDAPMLRDGVNWISPDQFTFNLLRNSGNDNNVNQVKVSVKGSVDLSKIPYVGNKIMVYKNSVFEMNIPIISNGTSDGSSNFTLIKDGKNYQTKVKGSPVGFIDNKFVTIEGLFDYVDSNPLIIHSYSSDAKTELGAVSIPRDGWFSTNAMVRNGTKSIIIHQFKSDISTFEQTSRFIEIDVDNPKGLKEIFQTSNIVIESNGSESLISSEENFGLTADGNWIIVSTKTDVAPGGKGIKAWNINSKESVVICEKGCMSVEIFNPNRIVHIF